MHFSSELGKFALFISIASALPTPTENNGLELSRRTSCPPLGSLPIHWDEPERGGCGIFSCLPWNNHRKSSTKGITIWLNEALSTKFLCHYSMDAWNKEAAYVLMPKQAKGLPRKKYDAYLDIAEDLNSVLASTQVDNRPVVVLRKPHGKLIYETERWREMFAEESRAEPSIHAYNECVRTIKSLHKKVYKRMKRYAEEDGLLYGLEGFSYQSSVLWSDDWEHIEFTNWDPDHTRHWKKEDAVGSPDVYDFKDFVSQKDLRPDPGTYTNKVTGEVKIVSGWCEMFRGGETWEEVNGIQPLPR